MEASPTTTKKVTSPRVGVIGGGSWGSALANLLGTKGYRVDWWIYETDIKEQILADRENKVFLPGARLSANLKPTNDIEAAAADKDLVLVVVPSHVVRQTAETAAHCVDTETVVVSASKGIENQTHLSMTGVLGEVFKHLSRDKFAVLSGPSFAKEVAAQSPTAVTVAASDLQTAEFVQEVFATDFFRVYTHNDVIGVELGGSVKNVIAIAAGVIDGLGMGLNTRAALITRGQTEIRRLGLDLGANPRTFTGLAGIGDLILTCTGNLSRNYTVGRQIGQGKKIDEILADMRMVAEGVRTAKSVYNLSRKRGVEMPICHGIYHVLYDNFSPKEAVYELMTRKLRPELDEF
jgi:glycerol-3-phosphate dehydrogenase (NAD(P)+)